MKKPFKRVHFEFKTHSPGERFSTQKKPRSEVRTIVFEYGPGSTAKPWTLEELKTLKKGTLVLDSRRAFLEKAVRAGKRVVAGEAFREQDDETILKALDKNAHATWKSFLADPNFINSKKYLVAFAVRVLSFSITQKS